MNVYLLLKLVFGIISVSSMETLYFFFIYYKYLHFVEISVMLISYGLINFTCICNGFQSDFFCEAPKTGFWIFFSVKSVDF